MADQWLCLIDGQKIGPVKFTRLQQLAEAGRLKAQDYVRPATQEKWLAAGDVANLIPSPVVTPETAETTRHSEPAPEKRRHSGPLPIAKQILESDEVTVAMPAPSRRKAPAGSIPVGEAVSATPLVGKPVSATSGESEFPLFLAAEAKDSAGGNGSHVPGKKKKSNLTSLMIGGGAVVAALGLVLVLVLSGVIDLSGSSNEVAATPAKKPKPAAKAAPTEQDEANPADSEGEGQDAKKTTKRKSDGKHPLLATVARFNDVSKSSVKLGGIKVSVSGLWLSTTEAGAPYVAEATAASASPKFLVVKVKIDNPPGAAPMEYKGWGDEAVLFDDGDKAIQPLPPGESADRIARQRIAPGSSLVDTLVFPLENVEFEKLRLALPHETVGVKDSKSFGLELPRHALGRGLDTQVAGDVDPAISARRTNSGDDEEIIDKTPAATPPPVNPMPEKPAPAKPKDEVDEVTRKLMEREKMLDKMEKEKGK